MPTRPGATPSRATRPSTRRRLFDTVQSPGPRRPPPTSAWCVNLPKPITHEQRLRGLTPTARLPDRDRAPRAARPRPLDTAAASFAPSDLGTLAAFLHRLPRVPVRGGGAAPAFFDDARWEQQLEQVLGAVGAEWVPFDTVTLFETPASSDAERESW